MRIKEATKLTGKSRTAILRAIQDGKLSASKGDDGAWDIEPSELARVYEITLPDTEGDAHPEHVRTHVSSAQRTGPGAQGDTPSKPLENEVLQVKLQAAEEALRKTVEDRDRELEHRDETISDLRTRLDRVEERYEAAQTKLTALLTDQRERAPEEAVGPPKPPRVRAGVWLALGAVLAALAILAGLYFFAPNVLVGSSLSAL